MSSLGYSCDHFLTLSSLHFSRYLTFVKGMEVEDAIKFINSQCPPAVPVVEAWEEVWTHFLYFYICFEPPESFSAVFLRSRQGLEVET